MPPKSRERLPQLATGGSDLRAAAGDRAADGPGGNAPLAAGLLDPSRIGNLQRLPSVDAVVGETRRAREQAPLIETVRRRAQGPGQPERAETFDQRTDRPRIRQRDEVSEQALRLWHQPHGHPRHHGEVRLCEEPVERWPEAPFIEVLRL